MDKLKLLINHSEILRYLVCEKIRIGDSHVPHAEFAHNHAVNRSSGFSPFQVIYGFSPRAPVDLFSLPDQTRSHGTADDFVEDIHHIDELTRHNLDTSTQKYKTAADAK